MEREHHQVAIGELKVAPGVSDRIPVDFETGVGGWRERYELRHGPARQRQQHTTERHVMRADLRYRHNQAAEDVAQQNGHEGAHLDHAVAAGQLALTERLRKVGKFDRLEQRRVQAHQKCASKQQRHLQVDVAAQKARGRDQHDDNFQVLDEADHARFFELVGQLPAGAAKGVPTMQMLPLAAKAA